MKNNIVISLIVIILLTSMVLVIAPTSVEYETDITDDVTVTLKSKTEVEKGPASWTSTGGGDHGGEDWLPENWQEIGGLHVNINRFIIRMNYNIRVWNQSEDSVFGGKVKIFANNIMINGTLSANESGYKGGNGGLLTYGINYGGEAGDGSNSKDGETSHGGAAGGGAGGGSHCSAGGNGGNGAGYYSRYAGGGQNDPGGIGGNGGTILFGDVSSLEIDIGSGGGGGGGGGGSSSWPGQTPGERGGNGGGGVFLSGDLISVNDEINCSGGRGGDGGNPSGAGNEQTYYVGGPGGGGGGAAGGSIILLGKTIIINGKLNTSGGEGGNHGEKLIIGGHESDPAEKGGWGSAGRIKIIYHHLIDDNAVYENKGFETGSTYFKQWEKMPLQPLVDYPQNDTFTNNLPTLSWHCSDPDNDTMKYEIQFINDGGQWSSPLFTTITDFNQTSWTVPNPLNHGWIYHWRVRANDSYEWGNWSDIWTFTVDSESPQALSKPVSPSNYTNQSSISWSWAETTDSLSGIKGYNVTVYSKESTRSDILLVDFAVTNSYTLDNLEQGNTYYIRTRAVDNAGNFGEWSELSEPVTADFSVPITPLPIPDCLYNNSGFISWHWNPGIGTGSNISNYTISVGTGPGKSDIIKNCIVENCNYCTSTSLNEGKYFATLMATDMAGNDGERVFDTTGIIIDKTPPLLDSYYPLDNSRGVSCDTWITLQFSENVFIESLHGENIIIENINGDRIDFDIDHLGSAIIIRPASTLDEWTTFFILLSENISDLAENPFGEDYIITFTTGGEVEMPEGVFYIKGIYPANNSVNVSIHTPIIIRFSSSLAESTINDSLILYNGSEIITGNTTYYDNNQTVRFTPSSKLENGTLYRLDVLPTIMSIDQVYLDEYHRYYFTTFTNETKPSIPDNITEEPGDDDTTGDPNTGNLGLEEDKKISPWLFISIGLLVVTLILFLMLIIKRKSPNEEADEVEQSKSPTKSSRHDVQSVVQTPRSSEIPASRSPPQQSLAPAAQQYPRIQQEMPMPPQPPTQMVPPAAAPETLQLEATAQSVEDQCLKCNFPLKPGWFICPNCQTEIRSEKSAEGSKDPKVMLPHSTAIERAEQKALPSAPPEPVPPNMGKLIPGYVLKEKVGTGGFATVYKAVDHTGKHYAIKLPKFMDSTVDMSILEKFKAESNIWKKLKHKNIVTFYKGDIRPVPYMVIEYMEGGNLLNRLKKGLLPIDKTISLIRDILSGMAYAHRMASVHRDIKPENILFTKDGTPKIADWGIGKFMASESVSKTIGTKGTLAYSSPEQVSKEKYGEIDWNTDVFQLGIVFYEMLTGVNPILDDDPVTIISNLVTKVPVPPSSLRSGIPIAIDSIILRALEKEKNKRYSSADSMLEELKRVLKDREKNINDDKKMPISPPGSESLLPPPGN